MNLILVLVLININFIMKGWNLLSPREENSVCLGLYLHFFSNSLISFLTCKIFIVLGGLVFLCWLSKSYEITSY